MTRFQITIILSVSLTTVDVLEVLFSPIPAQETTTDILPSDLLGYLRLTIFVQCYGKNEPLILFF